VIALAVLGGLVLLYGWNSVFLAPRNQARAVVARSLSAARTQEQTLQQDLARLKKLADDTRSREAELARVARLVPADPDVAGAIVALDDTARQAQVQWSSFVPSSPVAGAGGPVAGAGGPAAIGISMKVAGSFSQVFDYLRRLESLDRLVVIDSLQLATSGGSGPAKIDADIKGRMFSAGGPSAAAAPAAAAAAGTVASGADPSATAALPKAGG
jgi:Tfp pilus assembly protein PilO